MVELELVKMASHQESDWIGVEVNGFITTLSISTKLSLITIGFGSLLS